MEIKLRIVYSIIIKIIKINIKINIVKFKL